MKLLVLRYAFGEESTLGALYVNEKFTCYTLEDEVREVKVPGETCIPEGRYEVRLKIHGGKHHEYLKKFGPKFHKGMLEIMGVIGFTSILIHIGNSSKDTAGCLLVGASATLPVRSWVGGSTKAYKNLYLIVRDALLAKETVTIEYKSFKHTP